MIDYIPPDIPPAIVKYADEHYKKPEDAERRWFKYLTIWNNQELYAMNWSYEQPLIIGDPFVFAYDCHEVRRLTKNEVKETHFLVTKYLTSYAKEEHMCHRDKRAFNQHTKPSDYNKKVKHITPKYIPKTVVEFIDKRYKDSWYPGATKRFIKYLTTWQNNEVYFVYWYSSHPKRPSQIRPFLYDGNEVTLLNIEDWYQIKSQFTKIYGVHARPNSHNKG